MARPARSHNHAQQKEKTMIKKNIYEEMKKKYGKVASWAIWAEVGATPKSNVGDLTLLELPEIYKFLNPDYVFVGLNVSGDGATDIPDWSNFHSGSGRHHDYKLRYALKDTPYWGAYLTDIIKLHADVDGGNVMKYIRQNPQVLRDNIKSFEEEIGYLGKDPVLVAMGDKVYNILYDNLGDKYKIVPVKHYSYTISKENYRAEVLERLAKV